MKEVLYKYIKFQVEYNNDKIIKDEYKNIISKTKQIVSINPDIKNILQTNCSKSYKEQKLAIDNYFKQIEEIDMLLFSSGIKKYELSNNVELLVYKYNNKYIVLDKIYEIYSYISSKLELNKNENILKLINDFRNANNIEIGLISIEDINNKDVLKNISLIKNNKVKCIISNSKSKSIKYINTNYMISLDINGNMYECIMNDYMKDYDLYRLKNKYENYILKIKKIEVDKEIKSIIKNYEDNENKKYIDKKNNHMDIFNINPNDLSKENVDKIKNMLTTYPSLISKIPVDKRNNWEELINTKSNFKNQSVFIDVIYLSMFSILFGEITSVLILMFINK